jgi:Pyruvate/2-oxoacid:ferredoxin oxidoreductase delta subunit
MTTTPRILYCHCAQAQVLPAAVKAAVLQWLCSSGVAFEAVADLCELSARQDPRLRELAGSGALKVVACYPRAVRWLFAAAQAPWGAGDTEVLNMRVQSAAEIVEALGGSAARLAAPGRQGSGPSEDPRRPAREDGGRDFEAVRGGLEAGPPGAWQPWFPVIDYERCTNCMQCLSFCLFGVYGVDDEQRIRVESSASCKTNCPACSRVCPEAAIIFPKYKAGPINGDAVSDADLRREKMKIDISALLGGDVYQVLRDRSERAQSRFSRERDADKALQERTRCLAKLAQAADIPPEVLQALPSPEEIQRRAEAAQARAQAGLGGSRPRREPSPSP